MGTGPNPYASNKAILHMDRLIAIREHKPTTPVHLHFVISDLCQQACQFCAYRIEDYTETFAVIEPDGRVNHNPNRMIPHEKAREILTDFAAMGGKAVQFTGGGEPTLHPQCAELMSFARELGLDIALVTNGVKLDHDLRDVLLQSRSEALPGVAQWTRISIDAGNPETYTSIRRVPVAHWARMFNNLRALVSERNAAKAPLVIGVGFVVTRENWREVLDCARIVSGLGVDNLRISAFFQPQNAVYFRDFHAEAADLCRETEKLSDENFQVINNFGSRVADLELESPDYKRCAYQNFTAYIGGDQNVYRCCVLSFTERGTVGSLKDQTLSQLWKSEARHQDYENFDARQCPRCQFNDKNHDINRMIDELPVMHGNFV